MKYLFSQNGNDIYIKGNISEEDLIEVNHQKLDIVDLDNLLYLVKMDYVNNQLVWQKIPEK